MQVCVLGLGYIGFPTACLIAKAGHDVVGVDINHTIVNMLNTDRLHISGEDYLGELAQSVVRKGCLRFATVPEPADVFILAVPTPFKVQDGVAKHLADLSAVEAATRSIAPRLRPGNLVILESTVPPHTTEHLVRTILEQAGVDVSAIFVAHAPERVLPGNILYELVHNDRIVGGLTPAAGQMARDFYRTFVTGKVMVTDATTAELVKLMENTYRDVNIALANELAVVAEQVGVNIWEAISLANCHPRVNILAPGPGVGGHCIAIDPYFVMEAAPAHTPLIATARKVNRNMPAHVLHLFRQMTAGTPVQKVAILGVAYKANVSDERESPSLAVAQLLREMGLQVVMHDPHIDGFNVPVERVLDGADAIVLLTNHAEYRSLNPQDAGRWVAHRLLLDTRGYLDIGDWEGAGFRVAQLGVGTATEAMIDV